MTDVTEEIRARLNDMIRRHNNNDFTGGPVPVGAPPTFPRTRSIDEPISQQSGAFYNVDTMEIPLPDNNQSALNHLDDDSIDRILSGINGKNNSSSDGDVTVPASGLQFYIAADTQIKITTGTIQGLVPSNINNAFSPSAGHWAWVVATIEEDGSTSAVSSITTGSTPPSDSNTEHTVRLAYFSVIDGTLQPTNQVDNSVQIISCGVVSTHYHY